MTPETLSNAIAEALADADKWDRCYPGNINIESVVDGLRGALAKTATEIERLQATILQFEGVVMDDTTRIAELEAAQAWHPIETAPKGGPLIDIIITEADGSRVRWCDCYYDRICDQWRTSRPGGKLIWVPARAVTHWRHTPELPAVEGVRDDPIGELAGRITAKSAEIEEKLPGVCSWGYRDLSVRPPAPIMKPSVRRSEEDVEELKRAWCRDSAGCDLADFGEGFEAHREELQAFQEEHERKLDAKADQEERDFATKIGAASLPVEFTRYVRSLQRRIGALERRGER